MFPRSQRFFTRALLLLLPCVGIFGVGCRTAERPASNMAAARQAKAELAEIRRAMKRLESFFEPMGKPANYDWLASHTESGQTFEEYLEAKPDKPTRERDRIYVLPLGTFTASHQKMVDTTARFLEAFYDLPVELMPRKSLAADKRNKRQNPVTKKGQIRTSYILDDVLVRLLPNDAAALIAFTTEDLYPDETMNYVFGQATLDKRLGVWSLDRLDDNTDKRNFLIRTLKIAAHETGHMFGMRHCTKYECLMSGTNHLAETDRRPLDTCPECTAKISWVSDITVAERYKRLAEFCKNNGLEVESGNFEEKRRAVSADP